MASIDQVVQQIRFALENLSERNGQHEFEHLCRHVARHRICFNILPATGPVGAGGDQGRDFESFRTFIYGLGKDKFPAVGEQRKLVFACSLQKQVAKKVRGDVSTIMEGPQQPDIIYFFSSHPLAVAARHKLQSWAKTRHKVGLEILDREALAEQLSDADIFWIAARYLNVPLEIFPPLPKTDDEYAAKKAIWSEPAAKPSRYSDFMELKRCARYALSNSPQDIPFWLSLLGKFEESDKDKHIHVQVAYELIVLSVRLTRSLRGQEERIRRYFVEARNFKYPDEVESISTVMAYVVAAYRMGEIGIGSDEIHSRWLELREQIENGIKNPASPNQLCHWLDVRSSLSLAGGITPETLPNIDETLSWWLRVAKQCRRAPTFPVQAFHDQLFDYMNVIGQRKEFDDILDALRPEIAKRKGDAALAESHFKRAEQFSQQGQFTRAIAELHRARIKWFSEETLDESIDCCILLASYYSNLGLQYASVYYGLAAGFIVVNSAKPSLTERLCECLVTAAHAAYAQGHWCLFFGLVESLLILHTERASNPRSIHEHGHIKWLVQNLPMAALIMQRFIPSHYDSFIDNIRRWGFEQLTYEGMTVLEPAITKLSEAEFLHTLQKNFTSPPFSDTGKTCEVVWSALGIRWRVSWANTHDALKIAGEIVAFIQIAVAEFAHHDLDVVPGELYVEVELTDDATVLIQRLPDNATYRWRLQAPRSIKLGRKGMDEVAGQLLGCVVRIIQAFSVMPEEKFCTRPILECGGRVFSYALFARRFPELIESFLPPPRFGGQLRESIRCSVSSQNWAHEPSADLRWLDSIHPDFDEKAELERIRTRYNVTLRGLKFTINRVRQNAQFRWVLARLRTKGWKDWHVLQAMLNLVANYRTNKKLGGFTRGVDWMKAFKAECFTEERSDSLPVPLESFSEQELEFATLTTVLSTMTHWGLEPPNGTPNLEGLREYLRCRWRYWELDVEHPPIFELSPN